MEKAKGEYILLLNSDTLVLENTINETVGFMQRHPHVDVLGCRTLYPDGTTQLTVYTYENELSLVSTVARFIKSNVVFKQVQRVVNYLHRKLSNQKYTPLAENTGEPVPNYNNGERIGMLMGVFLLLKKSVYTATKGFDPDFFMYYEESEWFINRLRNHNIVYYPKASIVHYYGKSDVYKKMNLQAVISQYLFWYKISYAHFIFYILYNLIEIPSRVLMGILMAKKSFLKDAIVMSKALPYVFLEIPRFSNAFGSRKSMLKLKYLQKNNL
jgi:GT2 family glycosyltransferase